MAGALLLALAAAGGAADTLAEITAAMPISPCATGRSVGTSLPGACEVAAVRELVRAAPQVPSPWLIPYPPGGDAFRRRYVAYQLNYLEYPRRFETDAAAPVSAFHALVAGPAVHVPGIAPVAESHGLRLLPLPAR